MSIKPAPQRWQDNQEQFDVVVVFEERLMDNLLEGQQPWKCSLLCSKILRCARPLLGCNAWGCIGPMHHPCLTASFHTAWHQLQCAI